MPGEIPVTPGSTSLGDYMTGMNGCIRIMMALRHREVTGKGQVVDCALFESVFRVLDGNCSPLCDGWLCARAGGTGTVNACRMDTFLQGMENFWQ